MMSELISVIVPVYNVEKYLERCLESIINQSYTNIEIILIDDGSKDSSGAICDSYQQKDKRIIVRHIENAGVSNARNIGVSISNGKYIVFIDADDTIQYNMIERMYDILIKENVDIVKANYFLEKDNLKLNNTELIIEGRYNNKEIRECVIENILKEKIKCYIWLLLIKKELFEKFDKRLFIFEDANMYLNLFSKAQSIYITSECLYNYNIANVNSVTKSVESYKKNADNMVLANKIMIDTLNKYGINSRKKRQILNTRIVNDVLNYYYLIYRKNNSIKEIIKIYEEMSLNENFKTMLSEIDINILSRKERMFNDAFINKKYLKLYILCKVKNVINKRK